MKKKSKSADMLRKELFERYPALCDCQDSFDNVYTALLECYRSGGKILLAGNGGSAADCEHITGELMKSFLFFRALEPKFKEELINLFGKEGEKLSEQLEGGLPAVPLTSMSAINTAFANDVAAPATFAQLVHTLGSQQDIFLGISTSGNSKNIILALMAAKAKHMKTICLTGRSGGICKEYCDFCLCVPEDETFKVQELHLPVYHTLCAMLEAELFSEQ